MMLTTDTIRAYRETEYRARFVKRPVAFRIGEPCPALDEMMALYRVETAGFLTAWNPHGERWPIGRNKVTQAHLKRSIRDLGLSIFHGDGRGPELDGTGARWIEPSLLAMGISVDKLIALSTLYRQHASVWIERGKPPELLITPVVSDAVIA